MSRLAFAALLAVSCSGPAPVELPASDTSGMEAPVAAKIEEARRTVLERPQEGGAWGRVGMIYQAHALYLPAVICYRRAAERSPDDYRWPYLAAMAQQKTDLEQAASFFSAASRHEPSNPAFYVHYGNLLMDLGDLDGAERQYRAALAQAPALSHALHGLGRVEFQRGLLEAALEPLEAAAESAPTHGEVHGLLAQIYHRQGEAEKARLAELRARLYPESTRAEDPVLEAMEAEAAGSRAHNRRGLWFVRAGRWAEAEKELRRVLEIRPGNVRDFANLGGALSRQGKHQEAVEVYRQALEVKPGDPSALNNLALSLAELGETERAVGHLEEILRADPAHAGAHHNLGRVRFRQGRIEAAVTHYEEALRLQPALLEAYVDLGTALAALGRLGEAAESWRSALAIDPRQVAALYNLSVVLAGRGEHEEAVEHLRQGLRLAPDSSRIGALLAWELATAPRAELRDGVEARRLAERIYTAYPNRADSLDVLAAALAETGDFEAAAAAARQGLRLAREAGRPKQAEEISRRLAGYEKGQPHRQSPPPPGAPRFP